MRAFWRGLRSSCSAASWNRIRRRAWIFPVSFCVPAAAGERTAHPGRYRAVGQRVTIAPTSPAAAPPPHPRASHISEARSAAVAPVATGTFIHANPSDPIHWGKGKVSAYDRTHFPRVGFRGRARSEISRLSRAEGRISAREADVKDAMYVDLGRLRAFKGSQRYPIPEGVDVKKYRERRDLVRAVRRADHAGGSDVGEALAHGHFTSGGSDDRMESTLPPVRKPKIVPRS